MKCPNCGATLVFNAVTNLLECRSCDSTFAPDESDFASKSEARAEERAQQSNDQQQSEDGAIGYTSYICSSCGAELVGTYDTSAIGFCSYCGGENILASRVEAQRPDRIIPFSRSKEWCKETYLRTVARMPFVPKGMTEEEHVNEIRGIYVPYSIYHTHHDDKARVYYSKSDKDYKYTYKSTGEILSDCAIPIDASVQLDDYIGSTVFPYETDKEKPFNESYLSTYYVELPDADDSAYLPVVKRRVLEYEYDCAVRTLVPEDATHEVVLPDGTVNMAPDENSADAERVTMVRKDIVLAPLYFLTYRNKEKVCYTVFPGVKHSSGMYAEIPVDIPKYLIAVLVLAAAIWAGLSFAPIMPTLSHNVVLLVMGVFSAIALALYGNEYDYRLWKTRYFGWEHESLASTLKGYGAVAGVLLIIQWLLLYNFGVEIPIEVWLRLFLAGFTLFVYRKALSKSEDKDVKYVHILFAASALMIVLGFADMAMTIPDEVMYAMMFASFTVVLAGFLDIIRVFNASCERERPHFTREGGHNAAQDV